MMPGPQLSPREVYYEKLRGLGLSEHSLKVRHGVTLKPRTRVTESVMHQGDEVGFISPMVGGWRGHVADPRAHGKLKRHEHSPFSSRAMAAAAVAVKSGRVALPQRQAPLVADVYDGDEVAGGQQHGQA